MKDRKHAIDFAEWLWFHGVEYQRGGTYVVQYPLGELNVYTIDELYDIFVRDNPNS